MRHATGLERDHGMVFADVDSRAKRRTPCGRGGREGSACVPSTSSQTQCVEMREDDASDGGEGDEVAGDEV